MGARIALENRSGGVGQRAVLVEPGGDFKLLFPAYHYGLVALLNLKTIRRVIRGPGQVAALLQNYTGLDLAGKLVLAVQSVTHGACHRELQYASRNAPPARVFSTDFWVSS